MSSLTAFPYKYHGFDGSKDLKCKFCETYRAHVTVARAAEDVIYITDGHQIQVCRTCLERLRLTLKEAFKEYMKDHMLHNAKSKSEARRLEHQLGKRKETE